MKKLFVFLVCVSCSFVARAELIAEVTGWIDDPMNIAVVPVNYQGGGQLSEDIGKIVRSDLESSGQFKALDPKNMLSFPASVEQVAYRDWKLLNSDFLTTASLVDTANGYKLTFSLYDVVTEKAIISDRIVEGGKNNLRDIAHYFSDTVFEAITNVRGVFSTKVVYVEANRSPKRYRLMMADVDGARARQLYSSTSPLLSPSWSPDGKSIAYVSFESGRSAIYMQEIATGKRQQLTKFRGLNGAPVWSPDGSKMAMVLSKDGNPEIYVLHLASRKLSRLTKHFSIDTEPAWTADGQSVLFTSSRGGKPQIYKAKVGSSSVERLTFQGDYNARPRVSADGKSMVMVHRSGGVFRIASQHLETGDFNVLTQTRLDESPSVAPNSMMLIYATQKGGRGALATVSLDGKVTTLLPSSSGDAREPAWSPFFN